MCDHTFPDIVEFAEAFRLSDILGDGQVTTSELPRILTRLGELPSEV